MKLNFNYVKEYHSISLKEEEKLEKIKETMERKESMLDWLDIDTCISREDLIQIEELSKKIRSSCDIFLVIGIGGSYLGSKAVIDGLRPYFSEEKPEVIFAGHQLSASYLVHLLEHLRGKQVCVNMISKSGGTLEPSVTYQKIYQYMKENFQDYKDRIIITTSKTHGKLRDFAIKEGLKMLTIPEQIGGRYSVFTSVGLLPIAVSGIDIYQLLEGAKKEKDCFDISKQYAIIRKHLEESGRVVEAITIYEEKLSSLASWIQQILAETQGKEEKGILPIINPNTTNLHSIGQYFQEGRPIAFETVIQVEKTENILLEEYKLTMNELNHLVLNQVAIAHKQSEMPSIIIILEELTPHEIGKLLYFFEMTAAIGGYLLDINPFDQPGVEAYKKLVNQELEKLKQ